MNSLACIEDLASVPDIRPTATAPGDGDATGCTLLTRTLPEGVNAPRFAPSPLMASGAALARALKVGGLAVMQLADCPAIHMIFREFLRDCWSSQPDITRQVVREAAEIYRQCLGPPYPWNVPSYHGHLEGNVGLHIAVFMLRCLEWIKCGFLDCGRLLDQDGNASAKVLFGLLGACIRAHQAGSFPDGPLQIDRAEMRSLVAWMQAAGVHRDSWEEFYHQAVRYNETCRGGHSQVGWFRHFLDLLSDPSDLCDYCDCVEPFHDPWCPSLLPQFANLRISDI